MINKELLKLVFVDNKGVYHWACNLTGSNKHYIKIYELVF